MAAARLAAAGECPPQRGLGEDQEDPRVRSLPVVSVGLAVLSTGQDAEELGLAHAAAKNAASLGAGAGVAWGITAGAAAVGVVGLAPVVAGDALGGVKDGVKGLFS